ncbi:MAG: 3-deoxy-8-phosphooctulonate synthase [Elusimicrobia bacterium]|jgi:2-dehydro-3-deoxyphosphooctonate aldolase (KDO 8-P synthase)|nr:3-deoxy-8-phosphooctulonate synthase [Elusimicrobiota bacterium]
MNLNKKTKIKNIDVSSSERLFFIAGPCVIENYDMLRETADFLKELARKKGLDIIFKASYDKANRSSLSSFRGPGIKDGLSMLEKIKKETGLPLLVDVHSVAEVSKAAEVADCLQIPAFLCRQTDLLVAAGSTGLPVNIKKGQFMSPRAMNLQAQKVQKSGSSGVILTERGTTFGYGDLVVDMRSLIVMKKNGYPVIYDATHSQQQPATADETTGGRKEFIVPLARAAAATGVNGIYTEVHPSPLNALSDRETQLNFKEYEELTDEVSRVQG